MLTTICSNLVKKELLLYMKYGLFWATLFKRAGGKR